MAASVASVQQPAALPLEELAAWAVAEGVARQREAQAAAEVPQQEVEVWDGAAGPRPEAGRDAVVVPQQGAAAERAGAAEARQQEEAPAVPAPRQAVDPSAVPWAFHRGRLRQLVVRPAPRPAARFARAMGRL